MIKIVTDRLMSVNQVIMLSDRNKTTSISKVDVNKMLYNIVLRYSCFHTSFEKKCK